MILTDPYTIRIFSFCGGGSKGYGSNRFMQMFLQQWGVPQTDFWKYADVICGTSIGSILGCAYAYGLTPDQMKEFFRDTTDSSGNLISEGKAKRIFTIRTFTEYMLSQAPVGNLGHNASENSNRPNAIQKICLMLGIKDFSMLTSFPSSITNFVSDVVTLLMDSKPEEPFYNPFYDSPYPDSNYGSNILHQVLVENFKQDTLANLKTRVAIPSFEKDRSRFVVFSNYNDSRFIGYNSQIVDVCRASSAAPIYLPSYKFDAYGEGIQHEYLDGGLYANDAILAGINIGLAAKPRAKRVVIVGVGTGMGNMGFDSDTPLTSTSLAIEELFRLINVGMTGAEAWSDFFLEGLSKITPLPIYYYKFNPKFPSDFPNEMDNSTEDWFNRLGNLVETHYAAESDNISNIIGHLTA